MAMAIDLEIPPMTGDIVNLRNVYIDATPDGNYALRILRYYRKQCDSKWIVDGIPENRRIVYDTMNEHQDQRSSELDKAIEILGRGEI